MVRSQSTLQRQLRRKILKNSLYILPVFVFFLFCSASSISTATATLI
jgi:hypothetical protein